MLSISELDLDILIFILIQLIQVQIPKKPGIQFQVVQKHSNNIMEKQLAEMIRMQNKQLTKKTSKEADDVGNKKKLNIMEDESSGMFQ